MKRLLSIVLALILALSLSVPAFAVVYVDGESKGTGEVSVGNAQCVSAEAAGDDLTVTGSVAGDGLHNSVYAEGGGKINVGGTVTGNISWGGDAIYAKDNSTNVVVVGTVTEEAGGSAINASFGATVEAGSVDEKNDGHAINALSGANVIVHGDITEDGANNAINAEGGATVTVEGNITEKGSDSAIRAMSGATVIVFGNVEENDYGVSIACGDATIMVGGDVTKVGGGTAINANNGATVIVEGIVSGNTKNNSATLGAADLYLGQLNGTIIEENSDLNHIFYLIGMADGAAGLKEFNFSGVASAPECASGKSYNTVCANGIAGSQITITPKTDKVLDTAKLVLPAGVAKVEKDGTLILKFADGFKGGLQNMVLLLTDKPAPAPGPKPVCYIVSTASVTVAEIIAPEGVEEGLIKVLDSRDRAGLTIDKSLLAETAGHSVKVTLDGEELPQAAYSFRINADGSLTLVLSSTYMLSMGEGSHDCIVAVDGLEICFTVVVEQ